MDFNTQLCHLAYKYKSDKTGIYKKFDDKQHCHPYTPEYYKILLPLKNTCKILLEIGIGIVSNLNGGSMNHMEKLNYEPGASLKMWRDFFPNAIVNGIYINVDALFNENRINTYLCNQTNFYELNKIFNNVYFDFIIDDGSHIDKDQLVTFNFLRNKLNTGAIYIIEDVLNINLFSDEFILNHLSNEDLLEIKNNYNIEVHKFANEIWSEDSNFIVIKKL